MQRKTTPTTSPTHHMQKPSTMYQEIQVIPERLNQQDVPMNNIKHTSVVFL
jgi:hypothetical protein